MVNGARGLVPTGIEDNVRLNKGTLAPSSAARVRQVADLMPQFGRHPATVNGRVLC